MMPFDSAFPIVGGRTSCCVEKVVVLLLFAFPSRSRFPVGAAVMASLAGGVGEVGGEAVLAREARLLRLPLMTTESLESDEDPE